MSPPPNHPLYFHLGSKAVPGTQEEFKNRLVRMSEIIPGRGLQGVKAQQYENRRSHIVAVGSGKAAVKGLFSGLLEVSTMAVDSTQHCQSAFALAPPQAGTASDGGWSTRTVLNFLAWVSGCLGKERDRECQVPPRCWTLRDAWGSRQPPKDRKAQVQSPVRSRL